MPRCGSTHSTNQPYVGIEFNSLGARLFDQITAANVNKRFAIVLDSNVYSAPVIRERISGGSAQISGNFTEKTASDLAIVLRAGALPAPVKIIQNVTVGASLGKDSIDKGLMAGGIGVGFGHRFHGALLQAVRYGGKPGYGIEHSLPDGCHVCSGGYPDAARYCCYRFAGWYVG